MLFVFKGTNQVDPALYEKLISSLKRMHSLERFAVFSRSWKYPLMRPLLLGTLCNKSTTEVFINNSSVRKCTHTKCLMRMVWSTLYIYQFCYKPLFRGVYYGYHGNSHVVIIITMATASLAPSPYSSLHRSKIVIIETIANLPSQTYQ